MKNLQTFDEFLNESYLAEASNDPLDPSGIFPKLNGRIEQFVKTKLGSLRDLGGKLTTGDTLLYSTGPSIGGRESSMGIGVDFISVPDPNDKSGNGNIYIFKVNKGPGGLKGKIIMLRQSIATGKRIANWYSENGDSFKTKFGIWNTEKVPSDLKEYFDEFSSVLNNPVICKPWKEDC